MKRNSTFSTSDRIVERIEDMASGIHALRKLESSVMKKFDYSSICHTKQFDEFLSNPIVYFGSKSGLSHCLNIEELKSNLEANIKYQRIVSTSISAHLRNLYEAWVFMGILENLACKIIEPTNLTNTLFLKPVRGSKSATIVAQTETGMYLSLFLDTPLPYSNAKKEQNYRSRPDIGIYILDSIQDIQEHSFIPTSDRLKLLSLIECKESTVWPWTTKHIIDPFNNSKEKIKVTHLQMLLNYEKLYSPPLLFLVSRKISPEKAHDILNNTEIDVYDDVGFDEEELKKIARRIKAEITRN